MKKNIFAILTAIAIFAITTTSFAKFETANIKTSAVCGICKTTIEKACNNADGVKKASLDLHSKIATVVFDSEKTNANNVKSAISLAGYMADDVKPNRKAYKKLAKHCQSGYDLKTNKPCVHEHKGCSHSTLKKCDHSKDTKKSDCSSHHHDTKKASCCSGSKNAKKGSCCTPKK